MVLHMPGEQMIDKELLELQNQLRALGDRMEKSLDRIDKVMSGIEERVRVIETREASFHPLLSGNIDAAWRVINEHDKEIKVINKTLDALGQTNNILKWLLGIITVVLTTLLIKLVIGG